MKFALVFEDLSQDAFEALDTGVANVKIDFEIIDAPFDGLATPAMLAAATLHRAAKMGLAERLFPLLLPELHSALSTLDYEDLQARNELSEPAEISDDQLRDLVSEARTKTTAAA